MWGDRELRGPVGTNDVRFRRGARARPLDRHVCDAAGAEPRGAPAADVEAELSAAIEERLRAAAVLTAVEEHKKR